ncbi:uncharacterized protein B0I36DRAFT_252535 [Microdochium trichocladiopsis]|uniref:Cyanobacterial phytochrome B n=1 Tax=Microdochium trichocladiopsis TaxID=1682393 RepID=A0A9P9BKC2_9PEZI|nr:uncharacterized protein B0I36DRAFT_252535 [Microdochium trichocladiopsis]KAH7021041.1 hypothetical protein B0I36DRAFT_252535 [Microdochium trichocladiopsis]
MNDGSRASSSYSTSSDLQLGAGTSASSTADPSDRVFPIRSVVRVDTSQPMPWGLSRSGADHEPSARPDVTWNGRRPSSPRIDTEAVLRRADTTYGYMPSGLRSPSDRERSTARSRSTTIPSTTSLPSPQPVSEHGGFSDPLTIFDDAASDASDRTRGSKSAPASDSQPADAESSSDLNDDALVSVRFRHTMTAEGHAVITGRDGTLQRCEDEPIHTPGAVQAFGLLVAVREEADGRFSVRYASENSKRIIGYTPQELFRLNSFTDILSEEQADNLLDHIDFVRDEETDPATSGPDVFSMSIRPPGQRSTKLWAALHISDSHPNLIIAEFELEDDREYPLRPPDEFTPDEPEDTLYQNPTVEEFHESTEITSKPLRVLRSARKRRGEAGAMQVFDIMSQVQEQLAAAPNLEKFLKILVGIVKELTGFHRVMIYQFDAAFNGKVVTELVDPAHTRDLYYGLHFPASDIPKQARELYKLNKVRLLYDRDVESARLVCRSLEDMQTPLDLSHSYLRAMSPIHLKYLANMAVRSSMSISINAFNELWGLVTCHSYGGKGMRVAFPIRKMCRLVGDTASRNIERLSYASRLQARKLINTIPTDKNPSGYIIASSDDLLKLFDADFGMLSIRGETKVLGKMEQSQEALAMLEYLRMRTFTSVLTSQDIKEDFPDLRYLPGFSVIAGLLYVPLSVGGNDFIVFFRRGQVREVKWAGNPYDKVIKEGTSNYLEPRSSFQVWHERVLGKCREWSEEQVETAAVLCLVYGKFIEVWRQKEAAIQSSRLTRLLLANSAHEVRTPLNAIINYLEIALEGSLDQETRENLAKSHSASKSLIYVINDLLDLTNTEEGQELIKDEILELPAVIREATDPFKVDAKRKGIDYRVLEHPGLPRHVHGDFRRVRQAIANLTANAMQNTTSGSVSVECYVSEVTEGRARIEIAIEDTGCGMSSKKLDSLFQDLEQVSTDADATSLDDVQRPSESRTLGLGLAVVARIVRNMDGQLRLKSEEGKGSKFVIQLPFDLPTEELLAKVGAVDNEEADNTTPSAASVTKSLPPTDASEVMLVANASNAHGTRTLNTKRSMDEHSITNSLKSSLASQGSIRSVKSDADRLIDAISTPLALGDPEDETQRGSRRESRGRNHSQAGSTTSLPGTISIGSNIGTAERPAPLKRSTTTSGVVDSSEASTSGTHPVADSKTPIRPVKVPDEFFDQPRLPQTGQTSKVLFEVPPSPAPVISKSSDKQSTLQVLVAEDDPINMKILKKRLEKAGHEVTHAVNGEDCATVYSETPEKFDIILMDMQMPIVDGLNSTKMIRAFERADSKLALSPVAQRHGGIPILAVSASLVERERPSYIEAGFDGWILKPIDFKRLNTLLDGIHSQDTRDSCLYVPGQWERGGWFHSGQSDWADKQHTEAPQTSVNGDTTIPPQ